MRAAEADGQGQAGLARSLKRSPLDMMKALAAQSERNLLRRRQTLLAQGQGAGNTLATALGEEALAELSEIDAALARMGAGSWGRCEKCGGPIGRQRLQALPEARACLGCRSLTEP